MTVPFDTVRASVPKLVAGRATIGTTAKGNGAPEGARNTPDHKKPRPHWACGAGCAFIDRGSNPLFGFCRTPQLMAETSDSIKERIMLPIVAAASVLSFNLICVGNEISSGKSFEKIYRVDLAQNIYCSEDCNSTSTIFRVSRNEIIFEDGRDDVFKIYVRASVNRETGRYFFEMTGKMDGKSIAEYKIGKCTKAKFSGFPAQLF